MRRFCARSLFLIIVFAAASRAATIDGAITGTCGFYQGSVSNVVYSQTFSGDGTFCRGFLPGGSFINNGTLEVGDIYALASNSIEATAPSGYGVFVNFSTTYQVTQQYIVTPSNPPSTPTGSAMTFLTHLYVEDDGSGQGGCGEQASVSFQGSSNSAGIITIPLTFGQPIAAVETATITCNEYSLVGFGDDGELGFFNGEPLLVTDADGIFLGPATLTTVPEPATVLAGPVTGMLLLFACKARRPDR